MKKPLRLVCLALITLSFVSVASAPPAYAFFKHHHKKHIRHAIKHKKHKKTSPMVRDAQTSLANLGYYKSKPDGLMGPKTVKAIRDFQRDNGMKVTGKLTKDVYNAIIKADKTRAMASLPLLPPAPPSTLPAQPGLVGPTNQQYADPLLGGPTVAGGGAQTVRTQELSSRYGKIDINENINGPERRYTMTLNGKPVLDIEHQPSIIGISETFKLDNEDALIITTFRKDDPVCGYRHFLLTLSENGSQLRSFGNCTHGYQARVVEDSLFVTFPELDDERVAGATWRYENGDLERL